MSELLELLKIAVMKEQGRVEVYVVEKFVLKLWNEKLIMKYWCWCTIFSLRLVSYGIYRPPSHWIIKEKYLISYLVNVT